MTAREFFGKPAVKLAVGAAVFHFAGMKPVSRGLMLAAIAAGIVGWGND